MFRESARKKLWDKYLGEQQRQRLLKMCDADEFLYGANFGVIGKAGHHTVSGTGAFKDTLGTMSDLARHHSAGRPWMPALLDIGERRTQAAANYTQVWGLDVDGGLSIEAAKNMPFVVAHCGLGIESTSSTPELNKFRLVFRAFPGESANSSDEIKAVYLYLQAHVDAADKACKDASRFFFGGLGREAFILNNLKTLPEGFIRRAIEWKQKEDEARAIEAEERRKRNAAFAENVDADEQLRNVMAAIAALPRYVRGNNTYDLLIAAVAGVCNEYGSQADSLLAAWGEAGEWKRSWNAKLQSIRKLESSHTLGSLFKAAKELGGYQQPRKSRPISSIKTSTSVGDKPSSKSTKATYKKKSLSASQERQKAKREEKRLERIAKAAKWNVTLENAIEIKDKYFGTHIADNIKPGIQGYSGPTGTGKTTAYSHVIKWAVENGYQIIYATQSESQAREFAETYKQYGIGYRKDYSSIEPGDSFVCCNAAVRVDARAINWDAVIGPRSIFLADEFASIAEDLISGEDSKLSSRRAWESVTQKCTTFITGDANLKQEHLDLLHEISGGKPVEAYAIRKTSKPRNIVLWADSNEENTPKTAGDYIAHLLTKELKAGHKVFCVTNAQQGFSSFGTTWLEDWAVTLGTDGIYRADGETGHYADNEAYALHQNYNERLNRHQLALVSPANAIGKNYAPENLDASFVFDRIHDFTPVFVLDFTVLEWFISFCL